MWKTTPKYVLQEMELNGMEVSTHGNTPVLSFKFEEMVGEMAQ